MAKRRTGTGAGARAVVAAAALGLRAGGRGLALAQSGASLSRRDVQMAARALGLLRSPPTGEAWIAVVFAPGDAASRRDAERIAAPSGDRLNAGGAVLHARPVLADAPRPGGHAAPIAATGAPGDALVAAARARRMARVTSVIEHVEAGRCTPWRRAEPRVETVVGRAAIRANGLGLAAASRTAVRESQGEAA